MRIITVLFFLVTFNAVAQEKAVTLTFLKAKQGQEEHLAKFIEKNWFAMDRLAVEQGLFESYALLKNTVPNSDWDFIVQVTYKDKRGYNGISQAFEKIRSNHQTIKVDNKTLSELGQVVKTLNTIKAL